MARRKFLLSLKFSCFLAGDFRPIAIALAKRGVSLALLLTADRALFCDATTRIFPYPKKPMVFLQKRTDTVGER